jgi:hypothetical protein
MLSFASATDQEMATSTLMELSIASSLLAGLTEPEHLPVNFAPIASTWGGEAFQHSTTPASWQFARFRESTGISGSGSDP